MAYATTNRTFAIDDSAFIPSCHNEIADLTMSSSTVTSSTINTGIVGLKWVRIRARLKTLGGIAAGDTFVVTVQAGTGAAITAPEQIAFRSVTMLTGDLTICMPDILGWSENGFQSFAVTVSSSGSGRTGVVDVSVDCA
jgi:hypothetical protein